MLHRDISVANILILPGTYYYAILVDFDLSRFAWELPLGARSEPYLTVSPLVIALAPFSDGYCA